MINKASIIYELKHLHAYQAALIHARFSSLFKARANRHQTALINRAVQLVNDYISDENDIAKPALLFSGLNTLLHEAAIDKKESARPFASFMLKLQDHLFQFACERGDIPALIVMRNQVIDNVHGIASRPGIFIANRLAYAPTKYLTFLKNARHTATMQYCLDLLLDRLDRGREEIADIRDYLETIKDEMQAIGLDDPSAINNLIDHFNEVEDTRRQQNEHIFNYQVRHLNPIEYRKPASFGHS